MNIAAFTSICQEDKCWLDQYLKEVERLGVHFAMHFDHCTTTVRKEVAKHKQCIGVTHRNDGVMFTEKHKQQVFDVVVANGFKWAMSWDIDETYDYYAPDKLQSIQSNDHTIITVDWRNLWGDKDHVRVDEAFETRIRHRFINITKGAWKFLRPSINGPFLVKDNESTQVKNIPHHKSDIVCLHWGMMTRELRVQHKQRWDRIYTNAIGRQPYKFWDYALDEQTYPPRVVKHNHFKP